MAHEHPTPMQEAQDQNTWVLFHNYGVQLPTISFPHPLRWVNDLAGRKLFADTFYVTKFMMLEVIAAVLVGFAFVWLARRIRDGKLPQGRGANLLESLLVFVRDDIVKPVLGE